MARHQHSPSSRERRHGATWERRQRDLHHKTAQGGTRSHNREVWGSTPAARMGRPGPARRTAVDANAKPILAVRSIAPRRTNCGASHEHRRRARTSCTAARPDGSARGADVGPVQVTTSSSGEDVASWPRQPRLDSWCGQISSLRVGAPPRYGQQRCWCSTHDPAPCCSRSHRRNGETSECESAVPAFWR